MDIVLIDKMISSRLKTIGAVNHHMEHKELLLKPGEEKTLSSGNNYVYIYNIAETIKVRSDRGRYDFTDTLRLQRQQYEHTGEIKLTSTSDTTEKIEILFVQPLYK